MNESKKPDSKINNDEDKVKPCLISISVIPNACHNLSLKN